MDKTLDKAFHSLVTCRQKDAFGTKIWTIK